MKKNYEVMLVIDGNLEDDAVNSLIKTTTDLISKNKGELEKTDNWGRKKLAYPIKKQTSGYYSLIYFAGEPETVKELDRVLKITDGIFRFLIVHRVETRQRKAEEAVAAEA